VGTSAAVVNYRGHVSAERVARESGGYRQLVLRICEIYGFPVVLCGRVHMVREEDKPLIAQRVAEWLDRPRMSRPYRLRRKGGRGGGAPPRPQISIAVPPPG